MKRIGDNLHITFPILLSEALSKFSIPFNHPNGSTILIENSYIIKPNTVHKIPNLGFHKNNSFGDLIIEFDIIFPDKLEERREDLIKKLLPKRKTSNTSKNLESYSITKHKLDENQEHHNISHEHSDVPECATQ